MRSTGHTGKAPRPPERSSPLGADGAMKILSERLPIKYLFSDHGVCLGLDTVRCSYLFLLHRGGIVLRRRPVGDKVVENLNYEIPEIARALSSERDAALHRP
jgi:hypothetical protein